MPHQHELDAVLRIAAQLYCTRLSLGQREFPPAELAMLVAEARTLYRAVRNHLADDRAA
jgi:hypothetical protein